MNVKLYQSHITKMSDDRERALNCNPNICKQCGGSCCLSCGCEISPKDLDEVSVKTIVDLLKSGIVSVDVWEEYDNNRTFYLRMRNKNSDIVDFPIGHNECIVHDSTGCRLGYNFRGKGGRELVPRIENGMRKCNGKYTKKMCKEEWSEYQDVIKQACKELELELPEHLNPSDMFYQLLKAAGLNLSMFK